MNPLALIATYVGAVAAVFLITRLVFWLAQNRPVTPRWICSVDLGCMLVVVVVAAYGMSDGQGLNWQRSALIYVPASIIVLFFDLMLKKRRPSVNGAD